MPSVVSTRYTNRVETQARKAIEIKNLNIHSKNEVEQCLEIHHIQN